MDTIFPFAGITNFELETLFESSQVRLEKLLEENYFTKHMQKTLPQELLEGLSCSYVNEQEFNKRCIGNKFKLSLFHLNIRSLLKNSHNLKSYLDSLDCVFDIIALTEIGMNADACAGILDGYTFEYVKPPDGSKFGGAGIFIKDNINYKVRPDMNSYLVNSKDYVELVCIDIYSPDSTYTVLNMYRHPNKGSVAEFQSDLENIFQILKNEGKNVIILGDININLLKIQNDKIKDYINNLIINSYTPCLTLPTRITDSTATLIDHIYIKLKQTEINDRIITGNLLTDITDHLPNFLLLGTPVNEMIKNRPYIRIYNETNISKLQADLSEVNWSVIFEDKTPNEKCDVFISTYSTLFNKSFPKTRLSRKRAKDKNWVTPGLKKCIQKKNALYRRKLEHPTEENKIKYNRYRNTLTATLRKAMELHYNELFRTRNSSVKNLWDTYGKIINPNKYKKKKTIDKIILDGETTSNPHRIAELFNNYFCNVGENLASKIPIYPESVHTFLQTPSPIQTMYLRPTDPDEIKKEIMKLNTKKSAGPDEISPKIIKLTVDQILQPLTTIFNDSIINSVYPDHFKVAQVIPLHKKAEKTILSNYRPISLLSCFGKILEKLIHKRLYSFLTKHNLLYSYQFGFQHNLSTSLALIEITDNIREYLDKGNDVLGIYIDLAKAFDTVNHSILLTKLQHYGIRGKAHEWFKSYLKDRKQYVLTNDSKSETKFISCGVPQGSVLGPLLFLIYVNDIWCSIQRQNCIRLFADDTNIFIYGKNLNELKTEGEQILNNLYKWFSVNKLTMNIDKSCFSIFTKKKRKDPNLFSQLTFDNHTIKRVQSAKYLGIILDDKLTWDEHIEHVINNTIKYINCFKYIKQYLPTHCARILYYSFIYSRIAYGIEIYGKTTNSNLHKLQVIQNKSLKILLNQHPRTSTNFIHRQTNILKVKHIHDYVVVNFVHKQINGKLPVIYNNYFIPNNHVHHHNTRHNTNLFYPLISTTHGHKMNKFMGPYLWNRIPETIKNIHQSEKFKKELKKHYISEYFD